MDKNEDRSDAIAAKLLNPQGLLYHYTNQEGPLGILDKGKIWASHIRYLNDTKEYFAGRSFIERTVLLMKELNQVDEKATKTVETTLEMFDSFDIFVTSFSKADDGDSLNLWRAYARTLPGYSIGFSAESINKFLRSTHNHGLMVRPEPAGLYGVQYVPELGEGYRVKRELAWLPQLLRAIILRLKEANFDHALNKGLSVADLALAIEKSLAKYAESAMTLAILLPLLKHEGFSGEQEHRLVQVRAKTGDFEHCADIGFHPGSSSIVPHLTLDLPPEDFGIRRIVVGPCPDPAWAVRAVEMLLTKNRIKIRSKRDELGVEVVATKIPYRNW